MSAMVSRQETAIRDTRARLRAAGKCLHGLPAGERSVRDQTGKVVLGPADAQGHRVPLTEPVCVGCRIAKGLKTVQPVIERDPREAARMRRADRAVRLGPLERREARAARQAPIRDRALRPPPTQAELAARTRWMTREEIEARPVHRQTGRGGLRVVDGGRAPGGDPR